MGSRLLHALMIRDAALSFKLLRYYISPDMQLDVTTFA